MYSTEEHFLKSYEISAVLSPPPHSFGLINMRVTSVLCGAVLYLILLAVAQCTQRSENFARALHSLYNLNVRQTLLLDLGNVNISNIYDTVTRIE